MSLMMRMAAAVLFLTAADPAVAQDYPNRPIAMVVPFAAGGPGDVIGRLLATSFGKVLGQTVIIENVVGAGGTIGTNRVAKAAPDGYTLLLMHVGQATSVTLFRKLPYDPVGDFEPIGLVTDVPMVLVAPVEFPPKDFEETIAYVKANSDKVLLGNAGVGSASHLCGLLLMDALQTKLTTVQYRGGGPALVDVMTGRIHLWCDPATGPIPYVLDGKMKALAITTKSRLPTLPGVPTADEAGLPGFEVSTWYGLYAPRGTPLPVVETLYRALQQALKDPIIAERFTALSMQLVSEQQATPMALRDHLLAEVRKWAPVIKSAGEYAE